MTVCLLSGPTSSSNTRCTLTEIISQIDLYLDSLSSKTYVFETS